MKRLILLLVLFPIQLISIAQKTKLDSMEAQLATVKDTVKVNLLLDISKAYQGKDKTKAISYARQAKKIADAHGFPKGAAYALKNIGMAYYPEGNYKEVLKYWQQSLAIFTAIQDKVGMGNLEGNIGGIYFNQGADIKAIEHYLKALKLAEEIGDTFRIATILSNMGAVYANNLSNALSRQKALDYYYKALQLSEDYKFQSRIGTITANIGEILLTNGDEAKALVYLERSVQESEKSGNKEMVAFALHHIGNVYTRRGEYVKALGYQKKAYITAAAVPYKLMMVQALNGAGKIKNLQGQSTDALKSYSQAKEIAIEIGANKELKDAYEGLSYAYAAAADFKKAYEHRLLLSAVKDSIFNSETNKKIVNLQADYESEKKQAQINLLTKDKALQKMDLQRQKIIKNASLTGLIFILMVASLLFLTYRNKVKVNVQLIRKNTEINQQKEEIAFQRDRLEQMYNNLISAQAQLIQSEKMASLGQLTAGVAHEINNPINFVSAGIDSLRANFSDIMEVVEGYLALKPDADNKQEIQKLYKLKKQADLEELIEESEQLLQSIKNGANRTKEIVRSLKNFTRLDETSLKQADLHEGLDSTLVILNNQIKDRVKIIKNYGDLEPINCYPGQLNQVFMNILSNALQAIKGEGTIAIKTYTDDDYAVIRIKDSGSGMTEEVKKHIFEPFFTTKDVGEGTGLGLSISYGIIEKHKGKIEVESQPGVGTEFIIRIPLILSESPKQVEIAAA